MPIALLTPTNVSRILSGLSGTGAFWMNGTVPPMQGCCRREKWGWCPGVLHKPSYAESSPWCEELHSTFPCHLYSIGIGDSWDFESKMKKTRLWCECLRSDARTAPQISRVCQEEWNSFSLSGLRCVRKRQYSQFVR